MIDVGTVGTPANGTDTVSGNIAQVIQFTSGTTTPVQLGTIGAVYIGRDGIPVGTLLSLSSQGNAITVSGMTDDIADVLDGFSITWTTRGGSTETRTLTASDFAGVNTVNDLITVIHAIDGSGPSDGVSAKLDSDGRLQITSPFNTVANDVTFFSASAPGLSAESTTVDITGITDAAAADVEVFEITIEGVSIDTSGLDFSGVTNRTELAALLDTLPAISVTESADNGGTITITADTDGPQQFTNVLLGDLALTAATARLGAHDITTLDARVAAAESFALNLNGIDIDFSSLDFNSIETAADLAAALDAVTGISAQVVGADIFITSDALGLGNAFSDLQLIDNEAFPATAASVSITGVDGFADEVIYFDLLIDGVPTSLSPVDFAAATDGASLAAELDKILGIGVSYSTDNGGTLLITADAPGAQVFSGISLTRTTPPTVPVDTNVMADAVTEGAPVGTQVGITASSTDPDGVPVPAVTYSLSDSAEGLFQVDPNTGVVTVSAAGATGIDYESAPLHAYTITVQAQDAQGSTSSQSFSINVGNVASTQAVDGNGPTGGTVAEAAANGDAVGITASSTDINGGIVTYNLFDNANGRFAIDGTSGVVRVADASQLNFESATAHNIVVRASDGSAVSDQTFTINVTNAAPVALADSYQVDEDQTLTVIAADGVLTNDSDVNGGSITAVLNVGPSHALSFGLQSDGSFSYAPNANFNGSDSFSYRATDGTIPGNLVTVSLNVTGVNDAPVAQNGVASGNEDTLITGAVVATDVDNTAAQLSYSLVGTNGGATHGTVALNAIGTFTYTPTASFNGTDSLQFKANDGALDSDNGTISLTINSVNNAPVITSNSGGDTASILVPENTTAITTVVAIDEDAGATLTYSISGGSDEAKFQINTSSGALSFVAAPDFEAPSDSDHNNSYIVQVRASDGSLFDDQTMTIAVTDVNDVPAPPPPIPTQIDGGFHGDFDGNGRSDLLFRTDAGQVAAWQLSSTGQLASARALGTVSADWHIEGFGDFDSNGRSDILFRNDDGSIATWTTDAAGNLATAKLIGTAATSWHIAGIGDFDGNGRSDILFRNDDGSIAAWQTDSSGQLSSAQLLGSAASSFHVVGIGDFDGNGRSDILFRNEDGSIAAWQTDAAGHLASTQLLGSTSTSFHVTGLGDLEGNGRTDILFQNDDGSVGVWQTNAGGQLSSAQLLGTTDPSFHMEGTGDFNGDGRSDILWRDNGGTVVDWLMNGDSIQAAQVLGSASPDFHISVHHFDLI